MPLADAGVLQLVDDDQTIMPGREGAADRRPHACTTRWCIIESGGQTAVFAADLMPTTAHLPTPWIMGFDLYPMDTLAVKQRVRQRGDRTRDTLVFFEHDPAIAAGYIREATAGGTSNRVAPG